MIRKTWPEIAGLVGIGLIVALDLIGIDGPSAEHWAGVILMMTCGVLMLSIIAAVCRGAGERPRWLGFAAFGWGYLFLAHWYSYYEGPLPTVSFVPGSGGWHSDLRSLAPSVRLAHDAWALAFAILGSHMARLFFQGRAAGEPAIAESARPDGDGAGWRRNPAFLGLLGAGVVVVAALAGWRSDPETVAGAIFLLACALAGLTLLGAILAQRQQRVAWLGAAGFGLGYLILAFSSFGSFRLPTDHLLNAVFRPGAPTAAGEVLDEGLTDDAESDRVRKALDEPISLHFREGTSLAIVLDRIESVVRPSLGGPLRVYATDRGPLDRDGMETLRVSIDRENIPASEALRLCLGRLGLTYRVQSGYVRINPDAYSPVPYEEDPVMIAGHSLLAMLAAAIGAVSAPIIAGAQGRELS